MRFIRKIFDLHVGQITNTFPYLITAAFATCVYCSLLIWDIVDFDIRRSTIIPILIGAYIIGISEGVWRSQRIMSGISILLYVLIAQILVAVVCNNPMNEGWLWLRYAVTFSIIHLIYAYFLSRISSGNDMYWQLNVVHLFYFLGNVLLAFLIFGATSLILLLIDYLFLPGQVVDDEWIGTIALWSFLFYHPLAYCQSLLRNRISKVALNDDLFMKSVSYVFIPLMCVYIVIMLAYFVKLGIQWQWPRGGVSYWIAGLSVAGTLIYLLGHPYLKNGVTRLNKIFHKYFFILLFPILLLLFAAVYARVAAYGWTEHRYFVVVAGLCLAIISIYFIFSKEKRLEIIPLALAISLFIGNFGPWNAYKTAVSSQHDELTHLMNKYDMIQTDGLKALDTTISSEDDRRIRNIVRYLKNRQAMSPFILKYDPHWHSKISEDSLLTFDQALFQKLNYNSSVNTNYRIEISDSDAIKKVDLSAYTSIEFVHDSRFDKRDNNYLVRTILSDSLKMWAKDHINKNDIDYQTIQRSACTQHKSDNLSFIFCCSKCFIQVTEDESKIHQLEGVLMLK